VKYNAHGNYNSLKYSCTFTISPYLKPNIYSSLDALLNSSENNNTVLPTRKHVTCNLNSLISFPSEGEPI